MCPHTTQHHALCELHVADDGMDVEACHSVTTLMRVVASWMRHV
jgi:hypothetical protein